MLYNSPNKFSLYIKSVPVVYCSKIVVSLGSGPWDQIFGGGNSPAFAVAAVAALFSGLLALLAIPRTRTQKPRSRV
ncbi:sucrose transport protein SUC4 [Trifolium repens]|nr:sucrose transport protein SUC4 [Trifolium repens]